MIIQVLAHSHLLSPRKATQCDPALTLIPLISFVNTKTHYLSMMKMCPTLVNSATLQHSMMMMAIQMISDYGIDLVHFWGPQITNFSRHFSMQPLTI